MHTALYTWSNLITIKHYSRSSIVFDSEWGIIVSNRTLGTPISDGEEEILRLVRCALWLEEFAAHHCLILF